MSCFEEDLNTLKVDISRIYFNSEISSRSPETGHGTHLSHRLSLSEAKILAKIDWLTQKKESEFLKIGIQSDIQPERRKGFQRQGEWEPPEAPVKKSGVSWLGNNFVTKKILPKSKLRPGADDSLPSNQTTSSAFNSYRLPTLGKMTMNAKTVGQAKSRLLSLSKSPPPTPPDIVSTPKPVCASSHVEFNFKEELKSFKAMTTEILRGHHDSDDHPFSSPTSMFRRCRNTNAAVHERVQHFQAAVEVGLLKVEVGDLSFSEHLSSSSFGTSNADPEIGGSQDENYEGLGHEIGLDAVGVALENLSANCESSVDNDVSDQGIEPGYQIVESIHTDDENYCALSHEISVHALEFALENPLSLGESSSETSKPEDTQITFLENGVSRFEDDLIQLELTIQKRVDVYFLEPRPDRVPFSLRQRTLSQVQVSQRRISRFEEAIHQTDFSEESWSKASSQTSTSHDPPKSPGRSNESSECRRFENDALNFNGSLLKIPTGWIGFHKLPSVNSLICRTTATIDYFKTQEQIKHEGIPIDSGIILSSRSSLDFGQLNREDNLMNELALALQTQEIFLDSLSANLCNLEETQLQTASPQDLSPFVAGSGIPLDENRESEHDGFASNGVVDLHGFPVDDESGESGVFEGLQKGNLRVEPVEKNYTTILVVDSTHSRHGTHIGPDVSSKEIGHGFEVECRESKLSPGDENSIESLEIPVDENGGDHQRMEPVTGISEQRQLEETSEYGTSSEVTIDPKADSFGNKPSLDDKNTDHDIFIQSLAQFNQRPTPTPISNVPTSSGLTPIKLIEGRSIHRIVELKKRSSLLQTMVRSLSRMKVVSDLGPKFSQKSGDLQEIIPKDFDSPPLSKDGLQSPPPAMASEEASLNTEDDTDGASEEGQAMPDPSANRDSFVQSLAMFSQWDHTRSFSYVDKPILLPSLNVLQEQSNRRVSELQRKQSLLRTCVLAVSKISSSAKASKTDTKHTGKQPSGQRVKSSSRPEKPENVDGTPLDVQTVCAMASSAAQFTERLNTLFWLPSEKSVVTLPSVSTAADITLHRIKELQARESLIKTCVRDTKAKSYKIKGPKPGANTEKVGSSLHEDEKSGKLRSLDERLEARQKVIKAVLGMPKERENLSMEQRVINQLAQLSEKPEYKFRTYRQRDACILEDQKRVEGLKAKLALILERGQGTNNYFV